MTLPEAGVIDTSVLLRFFHDHKDPPQKGADTLRHASVARRINLLLLDLSVYEFVNVLVRKLGHSAGSATQNVESLFDLEYPIIGVDRQLARDAASIAASSGISGYDASFVAAARSVAIPLITADEKLSKRLMSPDIVTLLALGD